LDTKWKKYSHSVTARVIAFMLVLLCYTGLITIITNVAGVHDANFKIAPENSYYESNDYSNDSRDIVESLKAATEKYKNEEHILNGGTLNEDDLLNREERLFRDFQNNSKSYNPNLTTAENHEIFKQVYADKLSKLRGELIKQDLNDYRATLRKLDKYQGIIYYAQSGDSQLSNTNLTKEYFKSYPAYIVIDSSEQSLFPTVVKENNYLKSLTSTVAIAEPQDLMYVAFSGDFLNPRIARWEENKKLVGNSLYQLAGLSLALMLAFIYLVFVTGRKSRDQEGVPLNSIDRIYNDVKIIMCIILIAIWCAIMGGLGLFKNSRLTFTVTFIIAALGLTLILSLVKHFKNKTLFKHSLIYVLFYKLFVFGRDIYNNGSVAVKVVVIVIAYPAAVALTFFMFPVTIGAAAWIALKKVKEFNAIKAGVKQVKEGDAGYTIDISGDGELAQLAADINSITDGLNKAVENGIKSERLKSELVTNVSHDIRTPLTSIITYIDLLKNEKDPARIGEYIEVIDQKAQRLKILTEDLFEAAKASSGNIPVCYEDIEIVSLLSQGLGELDAKIQERRLDFKISNSKDKVYVRADGKLLWRAIENLFSNILKYALEGSRVYIDISDFGQEVQVVIKNISAYELNISSDELMERFKRGDESRSSQGSGLGLSIAKSLIEIQKGSFNIEIDGDLFKAVIQINKA